MAYYRIEVYQMGELIHEYEVNTHREARRIYHHYNQLNDCWTQLYVDGLTGSKAWMDRVILSSDPFAVWRGFTIPPRRNEK